jgi:hypothetical protein
MNDLQPGSSDACILKSDSCNNNHFKDQDEKSNETDCCYYTNSNSSDICEVNNVIGDTFSSHNFKSRESVFKSQTSFNLVNF